MRKSKRVNILERILTNRLKKVLSNFIVEVSKNALFLENKNMLNAVLLKIKWLMI